MTPATRNVWSAGLLLLFCLPVFYACSVPVRAITIVDEEGLQVKLVEDVDSPAYDHPVNMSPSEVSDLLDDVFYSQFKYFRWGEGEPVFDEETIERCAVPIAAAFGQATPGQRVRFVTTKSFRHLIFARDLEVTVDGFLLGDAIHLVFLQIRDRLVEDGMDGSVGSTVSPGLDWKLVPGPGQRLVGEEASRFSDRVKPEHWLVVDLDKLDRPEQKSDGDVTQD